MLTNSMVQQSLRRLASRNPSIFKPSSNGMMRIAAPAAITSGRYVTYRPASTDANPVSSDAANSILANQRRNRPVSPHLTIYQPQITWFGSISHRITGAALSGGLYAFATLYLVSPLFGWQLGSMALAAGFAKWGLAAKFLTKFSLAFPFAYHSFNGVRHLLWDMGMAFKNQEVIRTGYAVIAISAVASVLLAVL